MNFKKGVIGLIAFFGICTGLYAQVITFSDSAQVTIQPNYEKAPAQYLRNIETVNLYKELNHFSTLAPLGELLSNNNYLFSADINPLYIFSNSIRSRWNFGIGARVLARMFQDSSYPIRTPSFMPSLKVLFSITNKEANYKFIEASFTHHSNGQDEPSKVDGEWNFKNGNFSTNWIAVSYNWGNNEGNFRNHYSTYIIRHIDIGNLLSQDEALTGYYGRTRVGFEFQRRFIQNISIKNKNTGETYFRYSKERLRLHAYTSLILSGQNKLKPAWYRKVNTELKLHYFLKSLRDGGFFAGAGYYGEDPYNIYFSQQYFFVKFGLSAGTAFFKSK